MTDDIAGVAGEKEPIFGGPNEEIDLDSRPRVNGGSGGNGQW